MTRRTGLDGTGLRELAGRVWRTYGMITSRALRAVAVLGMLASVAACGQGSGGSSPDPGPALPDDPDALVLQVGYVGGYVPAEVNVSRLPMVSIYADGRVITEGPVAAIYPAFAWPNVQEQRIDPERVQELVADALEAGVAETEDLGMPPVADVPSTRFTVVADGEIFVREVYALAETVPGSGLTEEQEAARAQLRALLDELTGEVGAAGDTYQAETVAAVVRPWSDPQDELEHPPLPWPGPALPGEPVGAELTCVTATGETATALQTAAADANVLTPWVTADGAQWSVTFRPLLPHESGCADLTG
jgi:hypothetical protein